MPRRIPTLALLTLTALGADMGRAGAGDLLDAYRWRSRVLVVAAPDSGDPRLTDQRREAATRRADFAERDLVVIEAVGGTEEARALRRRFGIAPEAFRAVLIGKDGEAKLAEAAPIPAARLFATIDAMPMRRDEQRRR